jgi:hypothetical protein
VGGAVGNPPNGGAFGGPPVGGAVGIPPNGGAFGGNPAGALGGPAAGGALGNPPGAGAIGGPGGGAIGRPNMPQAPTFETVWTCTKCGGELSRGPIDPGTQICPQCGVKLTGPADRPWGPVGGPSTSPNPTTTPFGPSSPSTSSPSGGGSVIPVVIGGVAVLLGILVLGGAVCLIVVGLNSRSKPARRRRPRPFDDDDYRNLPPRRAYGDAR